MSLHTTIKGISNNIADVSSDNRLLVELPGFKNGIDDNVDTQITSFETFIIGNKGQSNVFIFRPVLQNENIAMTDDVVATLNDATTTKVAQIFRASSSNINTVAITTRAIPAHLLQDNFTTGWTSSTGKIIVTNNSTDRFFNTDLDTSSSSLKLTLLKDVTLTLVSKTFGVPLDWSAVDTFYIYINATILLSFSIQLFDGTNSSTWNFNNTASNIWEQKVFDISTPSSTAGILNTSAITRIGITVNTLGNLTGNSAWIDSLISQSVPNPTYLKVYDMGTNIKPNSLNLGTLLTLDDGNTELQISNPTIKSTIRFPLKIGITTTNQIKKGNYYALVLDNHGTGIVEVYGDGKRNSYIEGNLFTSSGTSLNHLPDKAAAFCIFAYKKCFIRQLLVSMNYPPGQSSAITYVYSTLAHFREQTLLDNTRFHNKQYTIVDYTDIPVPLKDDDAIVMTYHDDFNSSTTEVQIGINVIYKNFDLSTGQDVQSSSLE